MLAKILEDMWVEPEVLEALSEDQKRILFLKMREEQVRRWTEWEEREEREGRDNNNNNNKLKKADNKHVKWLLGRDGDVSVRVIGEVDEFRSSKLLQSLTNNRVHGDHLNGVQTVDLLPGREAQQLDLKQDIQLSPADVSNDAAPAHEQWDEEDSCSADGEPKDPAEDSDSESGSYDLGDWTPLYRPHFSSHGNQAPLKDKLPDTERASAQDRETVFCEEKKSEHGGRVAQLRKAFTDDAHSTRAYTKPAVPAKPAHLQKSSTPLIH